MIAGYPGLLGPVAAGRSAVECAAVADRHAPMSADRPALRRGIALRCGIALRRGLALVAALTLGTAACSGATPPGPTSEPPSSPSTAVASSVPPSDTVPSPGRSAPAATRTSLGPSSGVLVGVNLDWAHDSPGAIDARLGRTPAVWVQFVALPFAAADRSSLAGFVDAVAGQGGIALLTVQPDDGLGLVDDAAIGDLVGAVAAANERGVPVIVRFAHEMNGSWYPWGEQPDEYVAAFRRVAAAIHAGTTDAAMLWAPNDGGGYPFAGGAYEATPGTPDFAVLDTNGDGRLSMDDDPYGPYYPGDDAVDWVGMSVYHWGDRWPWGANVLPEPGKFAAKLTGTYDGMGGDERPLPDFYAGYAVGHAKPMAIPETAAFYRPSAADGARELAVKRAWWRQVFSAETLARFPRLRLVDWFDWRKFETEVDDVVDWRVSADPSIVATFLRDLPAGFRFAAP
jgi:hypothetical protein